MFKYCFCVDDNRDDRLNEIFYSNFISPIHASTRQESSQIDIFHLIDYLPEIFRLKR